MGCDCGCGGECPMCAPRLAREMGGRAAVIGEAVRVFEHGKTSKAGEVVFHKKSSWQKDDCINRSAEYDCSNAATLEAVLGDARIRCCEDERCKKVAAMFARTCGGL